LADVFAAALAKEKKAELVTGDPEFSPLEREFKIQWLKYLQYFPYRRTRRHKSDLPTYRQSGWFSAGNAQRQ